MVLIGPQGVVLLRSVALLEEVSDNVEAGFKVSYAQATPSVAHSLLRVKM